MTHAPSKPTTLVLAVVVTCLVAAAGLAATYAVTKNRIAEQERLAQQRSLQAALPAAVEFSVITDEALLTDARSAAGDVQIGDSTGANAIFVATDDSGAEVGWGLRLRSRGYGGYAQLVIGLDTSGKVTGVSVLSHGETPGLGTKVMDSAEYLGQFPSLPEGFAAADVRGIDAVTGATKSSNAVKNAVTAAGAIYADALSKGGE